VCVDDLGINDKNANPLAFRPNPESLLEKDEDVEDHDSIVAGDSASDEDDGSDKYDAKTTSSEEDDEEVIAAKAALNGR
jgi:hypothetical protein